MRRLRGPVVRRQSEGIKLSRLSSNYFGTGGGDKLSRLCGLFPSLRQPMDVRSCGTTTRETTSAFEEETWRIWLEILGSVVMGLKKLQPPTRARPESRSGGYPRTRLVKGKERLANNEQSVRMALIPWCT
jgi:hypothetical protein